MTDDIDPNDTSSLDLIAELHQASSPFFEEVISDETRNLRSVSLAVGGVMLLASTATSAESDAIILGWSVKGVPLTVSLLFLTLLQMFLTYFLALRSLIELRRWQWKCAVATVAQKKVTDEITKRVNRIFASFHDLNSKADSAHRSSVSARGADATRLIEEAAEFRRAADALGSSAAFWSTKSVNGLARELVA